ncbi:MAG: phosphoadenylyl-sulfate reductase [Verrucomicrobiota bacterium]
MSIDPTEFNSESVRLLADELEQKSLTDVLRWVWDRFGARAAIGTSFQGAGLVMMHHAAQAGIPIPVFTIDTGVLFPETIALKSELEGFLGIQIENVEPELSLEQQAKEVGPELWLSRPDTCCQLRKVEPLQRKLKDLSVWITGVRRQQSDTRQKTRILELYLFDALSERTILKLNPMVAWSREAVWEYLHQHKIPYNKLHDQGYRSIGCVPCTRPSGDGESERAGRWTGFEKTECGIHTFLGSSI